MRAEEFYPAYQTGFDGIGKIIEQAYHGYDDSAPIMVQPDGNGQVEDISDDTVLQLLDGTSYEHYNTSPNPAICTTSVNLYGEHKGSLSATDDPDKARFMVVAASAVIDLKALDQRHDIFETAHQVLNIKADQNQVKAAAERQAKIARRDALQAELDALEEDLAEDV